MTTDYDLIAEEYTRRGFEVTEIIGYNELSRLLLEKETLREEKLILDFGCGSGKFTEEIGHLCDKYIDRAIVIGVDKSPKMLNWAWRKNKRASKSAIYLPMRGEKIPLPDHSISLAFSTFVLCTMQRTEDISDALEEIHRVLKPGASYYLLEPHPEAVNHHFVSARYEAQRELEFGTPITVHLEGLSKPLTDYWKSKEDYQNLLQIFRFSVENIIEPLPDWKYVHFFCDQAVSLKDETKSPASIIIHARKL